MAANHLEQLVSEWYEFRGYFVRRNVLVGRRPTGGHECELDVVAFRPENSHLVHIEPSLDADSWAEREKRFRKKFEAGRKHIPSLFPGCSLPDEPEQIALLVFASNKHHQTLGGGRLMIVDELLADICDTVRKLTPTSHAIPEHMALLRTIQYLTHYGPAGAPEK